MTTPCATTKLTKTKTKIAPVSVDLYEDNSGGLLLRREGGPGGSRGYLVAGTPDGEWEAAAEALAAGDDRSWTVDRCDDAPNAHGAYWTLAASWEAGQTTIHKLYGLAARRYIGVDE